MTVLGGGASSSDVVGDAFLGSSFLLKRLLEVGLTTTLGAGSSSSESSTLVSDLSDGSKVTVGFVTTMAGAGDSSSDSSGVGAVTADLNLDEKVGFLAGSEWTRGEGFTTVEIYEQGRQLNESLL